ncbi:MAG: hypothetical protein ACI4GD_10415 [Lachnospiraceae bacterium]
MADENTKLILQVLDELHGFKDDMYEFKDEMYKFKDDMYEFKDEMHEFKDDVYGKIEELQSNDKLILDEVQRVHQILIRKTSELEKKIG